MKITEENLLDPREVINAFLNKHKAEAFCLSDLCEALPQFGRRQIDHITDDLPYVKRSGRRYYCCKTAFKLAQKIKKLVR